MSLILAPTPRPKILTAVTVPSGGWTIKVYISDSAQFDTAVTAVVAAGDYFVAWDGQADDFLFELNAKMNTALAAAVANTDIYIWMSDDFKINFSFIDSDYDATPGYDVKIAWTEEDGDEIGAVLGFDVTADDQSTGTNNPTITGDYQHAYGWYANEDGLLEHDPIERIDTPTVNQVTGPAGHTKTHYAGSVESSSFGLQFVSRQRMFSTAIRYGNAPVYPYAWNVGLQHWWEEAKRGARFRFYRDGDMTRTRSVARGTATGANTTSITDSARAWDTDPQRWVGRLVIMDNPYDDNHSARWHIASNTATKVTFSSTSVFPLGLRAYYIFEQTYETYWLDLNRTPSFEPTELPHIDRFDFEAHLKKYVT